MKITGIVVEYNPFHNGHLFQIQKARALTQCDYLVVVMSGNFAQRGIPCITDKFTRTEMALRNGADMVLELPVPLATASAQRFCEGAISILHKTGFVDTLCFGSEIDDLPLMNAIAKLMDSEPNEVSQNIKHHLSLGTSYPKARAIAIANYLAQATDYTPHEITSILAHPNNILGIEYIKAIHKYKSAITPLTIKRVVSHYHDEQISSTIASATAIRKAFHQDNHTHIQMAMPDSAYDLLRNQTQSLPDLDALWQSLQYKFIFSDMEDLYTIWDIPKHLCHAIVNASKTCNSISEIIDTVTSKTYSRATVQRSILRILLGIKSEAMTPLAQIDWIPYIRVLGCRKEALCLLSELTKHASVPVITNARKSLGTLDPLSTTLLEQEFRATHLYALASSQHVTKIHDFTKGLLVITP
ncbi:MAG: nucleotidyltransferase [Cellulosilyticaceae bacterium]